ncbi:MAG: response regulator [Lachnospiraceae bacterium]|nr:response regulator [Lachnospiraceae bacterium]
MKKSSFGTYIRSLRRQNGMTQAALAQRLGVTDKAVSKWERDVSYPDVTLIPKLADIFGVTADDLFSESVDDGHPSRLLKIYEMSHDIRTPLHMILGCADMAKLYRKDDERLCRYLESIRISGEYLLRSVDELMRVTYKNDEEVSVRGYPANVQELGEYLGEWTGKCSDTAAEYAFRGKRILVAEDIRLNREIAGEILYQTGAEVEFAENGALCVQMVEAAAAGYYDLILMDIMMPEMDGIEAARRIRQLEDKKKASVPIIAMSANVYEKDRRAALEAGMNAFTEKPLFIEKLFKTMEHYLS